MRRHCSNGSSRQDLALHFSSGSGGFVGMTPHDDTITIQSIAVDVGGSDSATALQTAHPVFQVLPPHLWGQVGHNQTARFVPLVPLLSFLLLGSKW